MLPTLRRIGESQSMSNVVLSTLSSSSSTAAGGAKSTLDLKASSKVLRMSYLAAVADCWLLVGISLATLRLRDTWQFVSKDHSSASLAVLICVILSINGSLGLYSSLRIPTRAVLGKLVTGMFAVLALQAFAAWKLPGLWIHLTVFVTLLFFPVSLLVRPIVAKYCRWLLARPHRVQYFVIVGRDSRICAEVALKVEMYEERCNRVVGYFGLKDRSCNRSKDGVEWFETTKCLVDYLTHHAVDVVLFATTPEEIPNLGRTLDSILELGLTVGFLPQVFSGDLISRTDQVMRKVDLVGLSIIQVQTVHQSASYLFIKRLFDIFVSASALLLFSPVFLLIGLLVKLTSRGPVFYPWRVLGKNRRAFVGYKFRTMVPEADKIKKELMQFNEMTGPVFKMRNDPRITPIGRWLRRFSLDEIPQLYSVLKGDMSFVGPRPPSKAESDRFEFWQHRKLSVKPGITCLWQVSGRNQISDFSDWAKLDIQYISTASFTLDLKILLLTVPVVLSGHGAY